MGDVRQASLDAFYWQTGPCCAGCDWWRSLSSFVGECTKGPPVGSDERVGMLGFHSPSLEPGAGHIITPRAHSCGGFKDDFDWSSLSLGYLKKIGAIKALDGGEHG